MQLPYLPLCGAVKDPHVMPVVDENLVQSITVHIQSTDRVGYATVVGAPGTDQLRGMCIGIIPRKDVIERTVAVDEPWPQPTAPGRIAMVGRFREGLELRLE